MIFYMFIISEARAATRIWRWGGQCIGRCGHWGDQYSKNTNIWKGGGCMTLPPSSHGGTALNSEGFIIPVLKRQTILVKSSWGTICHILQQDNSKIIRLVFIKLNLYESMDTCSRICGGKRTFTKHWSLFYTSLTNYHDNKAVAERTVRALSDLDLDNCTYVLWNWVARVAGLYG